MKKARFIKTLLVFTIIFTIIVSTVQAAPPPGKGPKKFKQKDRIFFEDVTDTLNWAKDAIDKMYLKGIIKGYGANMFKPNRHVTHLEGIIMALRIMGWEDEAFELETIPEKVKNIKSISWALGFNYVTIALEKGILKAEELLYFNPNEPAKRYEIARYIIRALNMEEEAEERMNAKLPFKDAGQVPEDAVGYVALISELGIMVGDRNSNFHPNKPLTRAEMAVLISRIDDLVEVEDEGRDNKGEVVDIDEDDLTITLLLRNDVEKTFSFLEGVPVYRNKSFYDIDDLRIGDIVQLTLNKDGKVIFIEVLSRENADKILRVVEGRITTLTIADKSTVTMNTYGHAEETFNFTDNTKILIDGKRARIGDLKIGDWAKAQVRSNREIVEISVRIKRELEGEVIFTTLNPLSIRIEKEDGDRYTLNVDENVKVTRERKRVSFRTIEKGEFVKLVMIRGVVTEIEIINEEAGFEDEGVIKEIKLASRNYITIIKEAQNGAKEEKAYRVSDDAEIKLDGKKVGFSDLKPGYEVELEGKDGIVIKIDAERPEEDEEFEAEGILNEIRIGEKIYITILIQKDDKGQKYVERKYEVSDEVEIELEGEEADIYDLKPGYTVEIEGNNGMVTKIDAEIRDEGENEDEEIDENENEDGEVEDENNGD
ncbi:MAG: S-layer homology domain-containing protein [Firmicutes bacterium]|nr:S-layer homology domain-containing protein [Bacillota bacterium]